MLTLQWRWPDKGGNNGVLIHVTKPGALGVWPKCLEVQLASGEAGDFWVIGTTIEIEKPAGRIEDRRHKNLTDDSEKPLGEWNTMEITCRGDEVTRQSERRPGESRHQTQPIRRGHRAAIRRHADRVSRDQAATVEQIVQLQVLGSESTDRNYCRFVIRALPISFPTLKSHQDLSGDQRRASLRSACRAVSMALRFRKPASTRQRGIIDRILHRRSHRARRLRLLL